MNPLIKFKNISKSYPGTQALEDVSFEVKEGEIHGIVGENGAGKSTLLKIVGGEIINYEGEIFFNGKVRRFRNPNETLRAGINVVHQELNLCPNLNLVQNIFLGRELRINNNIGRADWTEMRKQSNKYLEILSLKLSLDEPIKNFTIAEQQLVEIIKSISANGRVIVMDEPTSSLNSEEVERLFNLLRKINAAGVTIIFVSHRLEEVLKITDRVSVLRNGKYINTLDTKQANENTIVKLMTGNIVLHKNKRGKLIFKKEVFRVEGLTRKNTFFDINFILHEGEILGIAGLEGSGRYALVRALFGILPYDSGKVYLFGNEIEINTPRKAIERGIGFISRDRKLEGIFHIMDLIQNITIVMSLDDVIKKENKYKDVSKLYVNELKIKCRSVSQKINSLSGGNQQKSIVARWLAKSSKIMIMEEPTRGIDVATKAEIFQIIRRLSEKGNSFIIVSSELSELINEFDKIVIMRRGKMAGEVETTNTTEEEIMSMATGISYTKS